LLKQRWAQFVADEDGDVKRSDGEHQVGKAAAGLGEAEVRRGRARTRAMATSQGTRFLFMSLSSQNKPVYHNF
jgi:hypothetical protein